MAERPAQIKRGSFIRAEPALPASLKTYPVAAWNITRLSVGDSQPIWNILLDDDPTYGIALEVQVEFVDGSTGTLRWQTWRFGRLLVCPIVLGYEDGPPGRLEWVR